MGIAGWGRGWPVNVWIRLTTSLRIRASWVAQPHQVLICFSARLCDPFHTLPLLTQQILCSVSSINVHCAFWFQSGLCWADSAGTLKRETAEQPGKQQNSWGNSRTAGETAEQPGKQQNSRVGVRVSMCHNGPVLIACYILEEEEEVAGWTSASVWSVSCNPAQLNRNTWPAGGHPQSTTAPVLGMESKSSAGYHCEIKCRIPLWDQVQDTTEIKCRIPLWDQVQDTTVRSSAGYHCEIKCRIPLWDQVQDTTVRSATI